MMRKGEVRKTELNTWIETERERKRGNVREIRREGLR